MVLATVGDPEGVAAMQARHMMAARGVVHLDQVPALRAWEPVGHGIPAITPRIVSPRSGYADRSVHRQKDRSRNPALAPRLSRY
jgi:hypothetical protein